MYQFPISKRIYQIVNYLLNDDTTYYAASLSFYTIFAIFPILALVVVLFSANVALSSYIDLFMDYALEFINPIHSDTFSAFVKEFLSNSEDLGYIGIFYILFVFTMFFKDYEYIINRLHHTHSRGFHKSIFFYIGFIIIIPIVFVGFVFSISFMDNTLFNEVVSFVFAWLMLFFIFKISINRQMQFKTLAISSFATLAMLAIIKSFFIYYVLYNTTYANIYGGFSVILFFFLWIYVNWVVYLYGIRFSFKLSIYHKAQKRNRRASDKLNEQKNY